MEVKQIISVSSFGTLNTRDLWQTLIRIGFAVASVALGAVVTYFKETILPGVSDEAIFTGVVTIVIGLLETLKRTLDGPSKKVAEQVEFGGPPPEGYAFATGIKKIETKQ